MILTFVHFFKTIISNTTFDSHSWHKKWKISITFKKRNFACNYI